MSLDLHPISILTKILWICKIKSSWHIYIVTWKKKYKKETMSDEFFRIFNDTFRCCTTTSWIHEFLCTSRLLSTSHLHAIYSKRCTQQDGLEWNAFLEWKSCSPGCYEKWERPRCEWILIDLGCNFSEYVSHHLSPLFSVTRLVGSCIHQRAIDDETKPVRTLQFIFKSYFAFVGKCEKLLEITFAGQETRTHSKKYILCRNGAFFYNWSMLKDKSDESKFEFNRSYDL